MTVLGIETSCDETSAAIVDDGKVLANVISSQLIHRKYGGVVPELASRAHQRLIVDVVGEALYKANCTLADVHGIAATCGPGLVGALLVGLNFAKGLAFALERPFIGVNHLEGHLYSNFLDEPTPGYPFLSLIVSGGHTLLVCVLDPLEHRVVGQTRDDAAGEAFDKVAKMLGLPYPGGPSIERMAARGNPKAIAFPRTLLGDESLDFSFSGVKTAVLYHLRDQGVAPHGEVRTEWQEDRIADVCASFQEAVVDVLAKKVERAADVIGIRTVTLAGGVSANTPLRERLAAVAALRGWDFYSPRMEYCMDNGAMIAYAGWLRLQRGLSSSFDLPATAHLSIARTAI
jgi:N6-L-threonylcarbamoyladenine synthase